MELNPSSFTIVLFCQVLQHNRPIYREKMAGYREKMAGDESLIQSDPKVEDRVETPSTKMTACERLQSYTPGLLLQVFALLKFSFVLYLSINGRWNEKEMPIVILVLGHNTLLLLAATFQDFCTLVLCWITTCATFILHIILLVTVPIFVTSYFASDTARTVRIPNEWKLFRELINYQSAEERRFNDGIQNGMNVEMFLVVLVFIFGIQMALINSTLNAKLDQLKREKQLREKRNSVYLV
ncbi:hypothetical protein L3Y34_001778 [Caenorhabditis briggsae]|uniref:Uncharacterized protein n=3 Tax=Caenorhabditis briggsae TaxID=6238 RepID=A0AAE9IQD4_CAEBR|nr:hypothetical protein L3Y34_001778 [Caenorhabditis briggsae]